MRFTIVAAFVLLSSFGATPAQARYHYRHAHHAHHARHHHRHAHHVGAAFGGASDVLEAARSQIGNGAIYGRRSLWCARFMNVILQRTGHRGTGSDLARSFAALPRTDLHVGAIAVMARRGGGHVGIVSGITSRGDPIVISGNHGHRVAESVYARRRVLLFVEAK